MKMHSETFLWIHLGGIVVFPLLLFLTSIGLGIGLRSSYLIELLLLVTLGIIPVLIMQLYRPFNIFSLLFFSLQPESLTETRRKILTLFTSQQQKLVSGIGSLLGVLSLGLVYAWCELTSFKIQWFLALSSRL